MVLGQDRPLQTYSLYRKEKCLATLRNFHIFQKLGSCSMSGLNPMVLLCCCQNQNAKESLNGKYTIQCNLASEIMAKYRVQKNLYTNIYYSKFALLLIVAQLYKIYILMNIDQSGKNGFVIQGFKFCTLAYFNSFTICFRERDK